MNRVIVSFAAALLVQLSAAEQVAAQPAATPTPQACFEVEPAFGPPGTEVVVRGECDGLLHHRFIFISFDCTVVAQWDYPGGRSFERRITIPPHAQPGPHLVNVRGPFLDVDAEFDVTGEPHPCEGDCNLDERVGIDELLIGANIALGRRPIDDCYPFDIDDDALVSIDELLAAVTASLEGCPTELIPPDRPCLSR